MFTWLAILVLASTLKGFEGLRSPGVWTPQLRVPGAYTNFKTLLPGTIQSLALPLHWRVASVQRMVDWPPTYSPVAALPSLRVIFDDKANGGKVNGVKVAIAYGAAHMVATTLLRWDAKRGTPVVGLARPWQATVNNVAALARGPLHWFSGMSRHICPQGTMDCFQEHLRLLTGRPLSANEGGDVVLDQVFDEAEVDDWRLDPAGDGMLDVAFGRPFYHPTAADLMYHNWAQDDVVDVINESALAAALSDHEPAPPKRRHSKAFRLALGYFEEWPESDIHLGGNNTTGIARVMGRYFAKTRSVQYAFWLPAPQARPLEMFWYMFFDKRLALKLRLVQE